MSFLLLIGAGLMVRSLINLQRVDAGFRPENVLTVQMSLDFSKYMSNPSMLNFSDSLLGKVRAMPQVTSAAMSSEFPLDKSPASNNEFLIEGQQANSNDKPTTEFNAVTPDYFRTLGIPILSGRDFDGRDRPDKLHVAIVNQSLVESLFSWAGSRRTPRLVRRWQNWTEIVGVVGDVRERELSQTAERLSFPCPTRSIRK